MCEPSDHARPRRAPRAEKQHRPASGPTLTAAEPFAALRVRQMRGTTEALAAANDIPNLVPRILERIREILGVDVPAMVLLDESGALDQVLLPGAAADDRMRAFVAGHPALRPAWSEEQPVHRGVLPPEASAGAPRALGPFVAAPIRLSGKAMGAVFGFRVAGAEPFTTLDELAAVTLALQAAAHLSRVAGRQHLRRFVLLEERHRIAAELHAGIVDSLTAYAREAKVAAEGDADSASGVLRELGARLNSLARGVDHYSEALSTSAGVVPLDLDTDLAALLRELVPPGIETILRVGLAPGQPPAARLAEDILFIVREAVTNSVRHAAPSKVAVDLRGARGAFTLAVQDDGRGLDVDHQPPGIGLLALRNRAERSGGILNLVGVPGMGTLVHVTFPTDPADDE